MISFNAILRAVVEKTLRTIKKQPYPLDPNLPFSQLASIVIRRFIWGLRGTLRLILFKQQLKLLFAGPGVEVRCHSKVHFGNGVTLDSRVFIDGLSRDGVTLGDRVSIGRNSIIRCTGSLSNLGIGVKLGSGSGIDAFAFIGAAGGVEIGKNVIMGQHVSFHAENHNCENMDLLIKEQGTTWLGIVIGDNCWIGSNVTFLDGCRIGSGCVVGAGAVVRGTIPDNAIIAGVPAKIIRLRG